MARIAMVIIVSLHVWAFGLAADWPMGGGDPGRTSATPEEIVPPLTQAWAVPLSAAVEGIVAAGDTAVAVVRGYSVVVALHLATGEERWRFSVPGAQGTFRSCPVVGEGVVLVGGQLADTLHALDLGTGEVVWARSGFENLYADPLLISDTAIVGWPGGLTALAPDTGATRWTREVKRLGSPAAGGGLVLSLLWSDLAAFSLVSGDEIWHVERAWGGSVSDPVLVGDLVALVTGGEVRLWRLDTGRWMGRISLPYSQPSGSPYRPAAGDGGLFIPLNADEAAWLVAVEAGAWPGILWSRELDVPLFTPCLSGGVVYVASGNALLALDRVTGELLWQREFPGEATTGPIAAGGAILCGFGDTLYKLLPAG